MALNLICSIRNCLIHSSLPVFSFPIHPSFELSLLLLQDQSMVWMISSCDLSFFPSAFLRSKILISAGIVLPCLASQSFFSPSLEFFHSLFRLSIFAFFLHFLPGTRVADLILQLVPDVETFRTALRAIKFWARSMSSFALWTAAQLSSWNHVDGSRTSFQDEGSIQTCLAS